MTVAKFLTENYGDAVNSNDLALTTGATQGLHTILTIFLDHNGVLFVDEVTYMLALQVFVHFPTVKLVPVPMTSDGVDVTELRRLVAQHYSAANTTSGKMFWGMYYTIPVYHNPTGMTFTSGMLNCRCLWRL